MVLVILMFQVILKPYTILITKSYPIKIYIQTTLVIMGDFN